MYIIRHPSSPAAEEGSFLKLHRLSATFGRLNNQALELGPGLNILEAPNETGKSTWCAFLLAMFYGIDSRQRDKAGFIAEKNRYAPWSGAAMSGRLDCSTDSAQLTLLRQTKRATAPMGDFTARYAGTAQDVPGLTGQNCGEELLGVPRDVYERSAFIRQAGLGISANAELERRIVALITTGDEGTSFTESYAALKKQLNRRRHNKTGELPAAEAELTEIRQQLEQLEQQRLALHRAQQLREDLLEQQSSLKEQLAACLRHEAVTRYIALSESQAAADEARLRAESMRRELENDRVPENDVIARLRGAIVNLETVRKSVDKARDARDEALKARLRAETAVNESPFAEQTAEEARREITALSAGYTFRGRDLLITVLAALAAGAAAFAMCRPFCAPPLTALPAQTRIAIAAAAAVISAAAALGLSYIFLRRRFLLARTAALQKRFGTDDISALTGLVDEYAGLLADLEAAQTDADKAAATYDALYASLSSNEQGILLEVRRFAPAAFDTAAADAALRECAVRRKALAEADADAQHARTRCEILAQQLPDVPPPTGEERNAPPPAVSRPEAEALLTEVQARLAVQTSAADRLSGQISAAGDPDVLTARAEELENTIRTLTGEYDAIALAMSVLDNANTTLQNRFSPALGHRAAEIFRELTGGRYAGVVLDRSFRMAAEPDGDSVYRDAQLLSAGAADQLYLAVRLAICEMILPADTRPPIVLDDALANYDDERCAAALNWLRKEAEHRQILLFTCHSREAEFFRNDPAVAIQRLTDAAPQV